MARRTNTRSEQYRDVRTNALDKQAESKKRSVVYTTEKIE